MTRTTADPAAAARRLRRRLAPLPVSIALCLIGAATVYPLVFVAFVAVKTPAQYASDPLSVPTHPTLRALSRVWGEGDFGRYVANSFLVVAVSVVLVLLLACCAGFAFAHMRFPLTQSGFNVNLAMMVLPASLFMVPTFKVILSLSLLNNYLGLILIYTAIQLPFGIFMMRTFFLGVPRDLLHAAYVDGASLVRTFWSIALPLARPAILTLTTLSFLTLWNDLLFSLIILQAPEKRTLTVGLSLLKNTVQVTDNTVLAAGMVISALPPLLLFVLFNRHITKGLTTGALR